MSTGLEGMRNREIDFIPDRLIADPIVFRGMTDREVVSLGVGGALFWMPVCVIALLPFGAGSFGLGLGLGLALLTVFLAGRWLTKIKQRMPNGLHAVYIKNRIQSMGLFNFGFIKRSGAWDVRRTQVIERERTLNFDE